MEQLFMWAVQGILGMLVTILWYVHRERDRKMESMSKLIHETREQYVHKDDLRDLKQELNGRFDKLEQLIQQRIQ